MSYDVAFNILVNGNRCKQYHYNGKIWIEAKHGSEYEIEIKNNSWSRILAVSSVDGLNVLSGKTEDPDKAGGYVIAPYSAERIDGFRYEDNSVAKFKFGCKGNSYAASKGDGSEKNSGVIGLRVYDEVPKPVVIVQQTTTIQQQWPWQGTPCPPYPQPWTTSYGITGSYCSSGGLYGAGRYGYDVQNMVEDHFIPVRGVEDEQPLCDIGEMGAVGCSGGGTSMSSGPQLKSTDRASLRDRFNRVRTTAYNAHTQPAEKFDMGTEWGDSKYSPTVKVDFERKSLVLGVDIFYASREALIEMGVPITSHRMVSQPTPQSFPSSYAKPPSGWRG